MKKTIIIVLCISCLVVSYFSFKQITPKSGHSFNKEINKVFIDGIIKEKKYTVFYFWAHWCGYSREGLINDYSVNYSKLNNDSMQSYLVVMSDTTEANRFMGLNDINLEYLYFKASAYPIVSRNIMDGRNKKKLMKEIFNFDSESGFPMAYTVDSNYQCLFGTTLIDDIFYIFMMNSKTDSL